MLDVVTRRLPLRILPRVHRASATSAGSQWLWRRRARSSQGVVCAICLTPVTKNAHVTDCGHVFHTRCIEQWDEKCVRKAFHCPNCRTPLTSTNRAANRNRAAFKESDETERLMQVMHLPRVDHLDEDVSDSDSNADSTEHPRPGGVRA